MVKIAIDELKRFLSLASSIKTNTDSPILSYLKMVCDGDTCTITKTNLASFIIHQVEAKFTKNFTVLLDQEKLSVAVNEAAGKEMKISFKEQKVESQDGMIKIVTLDDGNSGITKFRADNEHLFPAIPSEKGDKTYQFTEEMTSSVLLASRCAMEVRDPMLYQMYVHIKNIGKKKCHIVGYNNTIMYMKVHKTDLPDMVLDLDSCKVIGKHSELSYHKGGNYHFFDAGKTLFGFISTEVKSPDFTKIIDLMKTDRSFAVDRKSVISFCRRAIGVRPTSLDEPAYMKNSEEDKQVDFDYENNDNDVSAKYTAEVKKNKRYVLPKFLFLPSEMIKVLDLLPFEKVNIVGPCDRNMFITSDEDPDYTGAIREVAVQQAAPADRENNLKK